MLRLLLGPGLYPEALLPTAERSVPLSAVDLPGAHMVDVLAGRIGAVRLFTVAGIARHVPERVVRVSVRP